MKEFTIAVIHGKTPPSFGGDSEGASEHLMETLDKERPKIYPKASVEEDNTKMKSRKEKEKNAQILYQNPGDRSEPCYIDAECRKQKSFLGVGFPQTC